MFRAALWSRSKSRPQPQTCLISFRPFFTIARQDEQRCDVFRGSTNTSSPTGAFGLVNQLLSDSSPGLLQYRAVKSALPCSVRPGHLGLVQVFKRDEPVSAHQVGGDFMAAATVLDSGPFMGVGQDPAPLPEPDTPLLASRQPTLLAGDIFSIRSAPLDSFALAGGDPVQDPHVQPDPGICIPAKASTSTA